MKRKVSLMLVMMLVVISIAGCGKAKSDDKAKAENTTSATQETENVTKKEQAATEAKNDEPSKAEESSSEVVASGEVTEENNEVKSADNGNEEKEPEKSEEVKNEEAVNEPAAAEPAVNEPAANEPANAEPAKEEITSANADVIASGTIYNDADFAIAKELEKNFGRKTLSKGDVINLRDYCDWDSLSERSSTEILSLIIKYIELCDNYRDLSDASFVFNVFDEADIVFSAKIVRGSSYCLSCYVKR